MQQIYGEDMDKRGENMSSDIPGLFEDIKFPDKLFSSTSEFNNQEDSFFSENKKQNKHIFRAIKDIFSSTSEEPISIEEHHIVFENFKKVRKKIKNLPEGFTRSSSKKSAKEIKKIIYDDSNLGAWAKELATHEGGIWDEIKKIPNSSLVEQLVELHLLAENKISKNQPVNLNLIMQFALHMSQIATDSDLNGNYLMSTELILETQGMIGKLIYLLDLEPEILQSIISKNQYHIMLYEIHKAFMDKVKDGYKTLIEHYQAHEKTGLQDLDLAYHNKLPRTLAEQLITSRGTLNFGIIDSLMEVYIEGKSPLLNHEATLYYSLEEFKNEPMQRYMLENLKLPENSYSQSMDILRISLGYPPTAQISLIEAKRAVLAAMISHIRQGNIGSCFATSLAIEADQINKLKDLLEIVEKSKLKRTLNNVTTETPFMSRIADELIDAEVELDLEGNIKKDGNSYGHFSESPGIQAACKSIGIENFNSAISKIVKDQIGSSLKTSVSMPLGKWLWLICELALPNNTERKLTQEDLYSFASMAFSSENHQILNKVRENAIANMAEIQENGVLRRMIITSVLHALQVKLQNLRIPRSNEISLFLKKLQMKLNDTIKLRYDPSLGNNPTEDNPYAKDGGFVIYVGDERIDNHKAFVTYLKSITHEVYNDIIDSKEKKKDEIDYLYDIFKLHLENDQFTKELLKKYYDQRGMIADFSTSYDQLPYTPWATYGGNSAKSVLQVYMEKEKAIESKVIVPESAKLLLKAIIDMGKDLSKEEKLSIEQHPNKHIPLRIVNAHSFSLLPGHPTLSKGWHDSTSTEEWINKKLIVPGKEVSNSKLSEESRKLFLSKLTDSILPRFMNPKEISNLFKEIDSIKSDFKISAFRNNVLTLCQKAISENHLSKANIDNLTVQIDSLIIDSLDKSSMNKLAESAVIIADLNWHEGINDIFLCVVVNPGSGELELCKIKDNKSKLFALNQREWMNNKQWEFFHLI